METGTKAAKDAPYPYNLIREVFGENIPLDKLAQNMERNFEHIMRTIPEVEAKMVLLRYRDGQTIQEIANQYQSSTKQVRQNIHRSLRLLRHPSRTRYILHGYEEINKKEEQERIRAQRQEKRILAFLRPDKYVGPLSEIVNSYDRADAILARSRLDKVYRVDIPTCAYFSLQRVGITYIWQLCFVQRDELIKLRDIGPKRITAIERCLSDYQLVLDDGKLSADPQIWNYLNQKSQELKQLIQEAAEV